MTDYAQAVTPSEVCGRIEYTLGVMAEQLRQKAALLMAKADAMDEVGTVIWSERQSYSRWQPSDEGGAT